MQLAGRMGRAPSWVPAWVVCAALALAGCAETQVVVTGIKSAQRASADGSKGLYKVGDAYEINGVWYYPAEDWSYDETGIASYYGGERTGTNFHGRNTANGELSDMTALTAAHRTLPMPSLVRVTNLENGRQVVLRVNDRGPFSQGRILDVSRRGAQLLGFEQAGTARVRVQIVPEESQQLKAALTRGAPVPGEQVAAVPRGAVASDALPPPSGARNAPVTSASLPPPSQTMPPSGVQSARSDAGMARPAPPLVAQPAQEQPLTAAQRRTQRDQPRTAANPPAPAPITGTAAVAALPPEAQARATPTVLQAQVQPTTLWVQAGAFANYDNAYRLSARLQRYGKTQVAPVPAGAQQLYRVRVGPVQSVAEADRLLAEVAADVPEARIVVD